MGDLYRDFTRRRRPPRSWAAAPRVKAAVRRAGDRILLAYIRGKFGLGRRPGAKKSGLFPSFPCPTQHQEVRDDRRR